MKKILLCLLISNFAQAADFIFQVSPYSPGQIVVVSAPACPEGTMVADGVAIDRVVYADLFGKIGTAYGVGNGSSTFNLPNLKGQFIRSAGNTSDPDFSSRGTPTFSTANTHKVGSTQANATRKNGLSLYDPGHNHIEGFAGVNSTAAFGVATIGANGNINGQNGTSPHNHAYVSTSGTNMQINTGDNETRPANISMLHCIAY